MRIAFDLDDTLVPSAGGVEAIPFWPLRAWYRERLRQGTVALLQDLVRDGHDVWVYTTSLRRCGYVRAWFRLHGVRLGGVVNRVRHDRVLRGYPVAVRSLSKYPPAFGIDLLVDDLPGVAVEGARYGFRVLVVDPADEDWAARIRAAVL